MKLPAFKEVIEGNDIIQNSFLGKAPDPELMQFLGSDILKLSYIKRALEKEPIEKVADFYGVTVEGIKKFVLKENHY